MHERQKKIRLHKFSTIIAVDLLPSRVSLEFILINILQPVLLLIAVALTWRDELRLRVESVIA